MLHELRKIVALERALGDLVPNRLGVLTGDLVIGGSQGKNQVIGVGDIPGGRRPAEDRERLQIGIHCGWDLGNGVVFRRLLAAGADSGENLIDPVLVALQAHLHRSVRVVSGGAGEIEYDRLLLDHGPEADLLDRLAGDSGRNGLLLSAGGAGDQQGDCACENRGKQQGNTISGRPHTALLLITDWLASLAVAGRVLETLGSEKAGSSSPSPRFAGRGLG